MKIATMKKTIALALFSAFVFFGCREEVNLQDPYDYYNNSNVYNTKWSDIFEGFWTGMNNNYVFWDIDTTDWDAVYDTYMPYFKSLGTFGQTRVSQLSQIDYCFTTMLNNIVDGHFQLICAWNDPDTKYQFVVSPSQNRFIKNHPNDNVYQEFVYEKSILSDGNYYMNTYFINAVKSEIKRDYYIFAYILSDDDGNEIPFNAATGYMYKDDNENEVILYFHFISFYWHTFFVVFPNGKEDQKYNAIDDALQNCSVSATSFRALVDYYNTNKNTYIDILVDYLIQNYSYISINTTDWTSWIYARAVFDHYNYFFDNLDAGTLQINGNGKKICGAIIDIRGNGGGYVEDLSTLWGRIVPGDFTFAKQKYKYGDNRYDFVPELMDYKIYKNPNDTSGGVREIPLVLLVNKGSVSCSEMTALFFKALRSEGINKNSYVVGGTTWGGQGVLTTSDKFNAGQFTVAGGIINLVYTPSVQIRSLSGESFEGVGVTPDYPVDFVYSDMTSDNDDKLNKAIEVITGRP